jgi:hypothetical protein
VRGRCGAFPWQLGAGKRFRAYDAMPERVQVCAGALILSMRCTHPGSNRGLTKLSYLVCLFLPRRLRVLAVNLRFAILFPRLLPPVLDLELLGRVR